MYSSFGLLNDNIGSSLCLLDKMPVWATLSQSICTFSFFINPWGACIGFDGGFKKIMGWGRAPSMCPPPCGTMV